MGLVYLAFNQRDRLNPKKKKNGKKDIKENENEFTEK